jgi:predicted kinase
MTPSCILLIGIQAAGKSNFAARQFSRTLVILSFIIEPWTPHEI